MFSFTISKATISSAIGLEIGRQLAMLEAMLEAIKTTTWGFVETHGKSYYTREGEREGGIGRRKEKGGEADSCPPSAECCFV